MLSLVNIVVQLILIIEDLLSLIKNRPKGRFLKEWNQSLQLQALSIKRIRGWLC